MKSEKEITEPVEKKLLNEVAEMKFSFRKFVKLVELDALISFYNK